MSPWQLSTSAVVVATAGENDKQRGNSHLIEKCFIDAKNKARLENQDQLSTVIRDTAISVENEEI